MADFEMMTPEAREIVDRALKFGPRDRLAFVRDACGDDESLFLEVMAEFDPASRASMETVQAEDDLPTEPPDRSGERVGPYRLISRIGLGGMGAVYLAARDDATFQQRVAIKLVNDGLYGRLTYGRLRAERQMLATLEHPNIARLLDGGTASDGTPYFVMEYVDGIPLDVHCDSHRLDVPARLKIFTAICAAVQCAHQNLIVHRDLKPSNILVTPDGTPKLLDFGIAKLLDVERATHTVAVTEASIRLMTPNYASPEQVMGAPITTGTDVYALGLLLYELLTGKRPFEFASFRLSDIERVLTSTPVPLPSTAVLCKDLGKGVVAKDQAERLSAARSSSPQRLHRLLRGDLDVIAQKALHLEPQRRYASAEQLSGDIANFLAGRPITAQRDTWNYRAGRFIARYRLAVGASTAFVLLLIGFAATMYVQSQRIAQERDRATAEEVRATTVSSFLVDLFELSDPTQSRGSTVTAREILDAGARRVTEGLRDQPVTQATLLETIGRVYGNLGLYQSAEHAASQVLSLRRQFRDADHPEIVAALTLLGEALVQQGNYRDAEPRLAEALAMQQRLQMEPKSEAQITQILGQARQLEGRYEEAEALFRRSLALYQAGPDQQDPAVSSVLNFLAQMLERKGDLKGAIAMTREALEMDRMLYGADHPQVGIQLHNLAYYLYESGDLVAASPMFEESLALLNRVLGETHPDTIRALGSHGRYLQRSGRLDEAETALRDALKRQLAIRAGDDPEIGYDRVMLGLLLEEQGSNGEAEEQLRLALAVFDARLPPDHQYVGSVLTALGRLLATTGRGEEAEPLLKRALAIWQAQLPANSPEIAFTHAALAKVAADSGRRDEATALLNASYPLLRQAYGEEHVHTRRAAAWMAEVQSEPIGPTANPATVSTVAGGDAN